MDGLNGRSESFCMHCTVSPSGLCNCSDEQTYCTVLCHGWARSGMTHTGEIWVSLWPLGLQGLESEVETWKSSRMALTLTSTLYGPRLWRFCNWKGQLGRKWYSTMKRTVGAKLVLDAGKDCRHDTDTRHVDIETNTEHGKQHSTLKTAVDAENETWHGKLQSRLEKASSTKTVINAETVSTLKTDHHYGKPRRSLKTTVNTAKYGSLPGSTPFPPSIKFSTSPDCLLEGLAWRTCLKELL